jgi:threonine dehydratase
VSTEPLAPASIRAARSLIDPVFLDSPQYAHDGLGTHAGRAVVVKVETVNPIGAFKGRGTWLAVRHLVEAGRIGADRPLVVASTGNFGLGCAYAGRAFSVPVVVFADEAANPAKMGRIERFGASVRLTGRDFDAAREASAEYAAETSGELLVDGDDPWIATGAATLATELTDAATSGRLPALASAYIPVGNGSLIVGVAAWLRAVAPACRVVGVQSEAAPSMTLSWRAGRAIETETATTFAEGIATRVPVPAALEAMRGRVDEMLLVPDDAIRAAQAELTGALGVTVEGGAAASWAGLLADRAAPEGPALVLVTGGNIPPPT